MARIPPELALTDDELDDLMTSSWNMRVATIGPGTRINLTPLWFGWAGGRVYFYLPWPEDREPPARPDVHGRSSIATSGSPSSKARCSREPRPSSKTRPPRPPTRTSRKPAGRWAPSTRAATASRRRAPGERVRNDATARGRAWRWVVVVAGAHRHLGQPQAAQSLIERRGDSVRAVDYEQIIREQRDDIVLLTLNRPDKLNVWTPRMSAELVDAIEAADGDVSVGALVVTGAGRGFCAGADISAVFDAQLSGEAASSATPARRPPAPATGSS